MTNYRPQNAPYQGVYASMDFPPYVYKEFPKYVKRPDGREKVCENAREELDFMADAVDTRQPPSALEAERDKLASTLEDKDAELAAANSAIAQLKAEMKALEAKAPPPAPAIRKG